MYTGPNATIISFFTSGSRQVISSKNVKHTLTLFRKRVDFVTAEGADVDKAIAMSSPKDLENGFQIVLALKCGAEILITNDKKGFRDGPMKVMSSREFLLNWEFI